jgi:hypothetical protein
MVARFRELVEQKKFAILLLSLVGVQLLPLVGGDIQSRFAGLFWGIVLLAAVNAASGQRHVTVIFASVGVVVFVGRLFSAFAGPSYQRPVTTGGYVAVAIFLAMTAYVVFGGVTRATRINSDTIIGAICVYLLIGYTWANLYALVEFADPGSFNIPAHAGAGNVIAEYTFGYYSFVTLTTLGYGDVTPLSYAARTLSWMEAVAGVTYMATIVAFLVAQAIADRQLDS